MNKTEAFITAISPLGGPPPDHSLSNNVTVHLKLTRDQTRHRQTIAKLQPARDDMLRSVDYSVVSDPSAQLAVRRKAGVWAVFFKKRISEPLKFTARLLGQLRKGPRSRHDIDLHAVFRIEII